MSDGNSKQSFSPESFDDLLYKGRILTARLEDTAKALLEQAQSIQESVCYFKFLFHHPDICAGGEGFRDNPKEEKGDKEGDYNHEDHH